MSGFQHEIDDNCAVLGYYAASIGNSLLMFETTDQSHLGTDRLSRNLGKELPVLTA
jgi:hypothetical protein